MTLADLLAFADRHLVTIAVVLWLALCLPVAVLMGKSIAHGESADRVRQGRERRRETRD